MQYSDYGQGARQYLDSTILDLSGSFSIKPSGDRRGSTYNLNDVISSHNCKASSREVGKHSIALFVKPPEKIGIYDLKAPVA